MARSQSPQNRKSETPRRIGQLSVLPVFFNLRGKPVLVIGGGEPAAWKAELLAQAGAHVRVVAVEISSELFGLVTRDDLQGEVEIHTRRFAEADFSGMALVVVDAEDDVEAALIAQTAARLGVPCNTIDRSEFCTFQFGTIVNRSPVVIGISTDGAAPVLGQSIRSAIEAVLPLTLSRWAAYAREIRPVVLDRFRPGSDRRQFWARFASLAFGPFLPETVWLSGIAKPGWSKQGSVHTLRVHPHDQEELTLRSIRILRNADIIYCHPDVSASILDHARREARRSFTYASGELDTEISSCVESGQCVVLVEPRMNPMAAAAAQTGGSHDILQAKQASYRGFDPAGRKMMRATSLSACCISSMDSSRSFLAKSE